MPLIILSIHDKGNPNYPKSSFITQKQIIQKRQKRDYCTQEEDSSVIRQTDTSQPNCGRKSNKRLRRPVYLSDGLVYLKSTVACLPKAAGGTIFCFFPLQCSCNTIFFILPSYFFSSFIFVLPVLLFIERGCCGRDRARGSRRTKWVGWISIWKKRSKIVRYEESVRFDLNGWSITRRMY